MSRLVAFYHRARRWLIALVWPTPAAQPEANTQLLENWPHPNDEVTEATPDTALRIEWDFRADILDRLEEYFYCFRKIRRFDPQAYDLFTKIGLSVPKHGYANPAYPWAITAEKAPAHGGVLGPSSDERGMVMPSFVYFQKLAHPPHVQRAALVYRLVVVWDDRKKGQRWASTMVTPKMCYVSIDPAGTFRLLKEDLRDRESFVVRHKGKPSRRVEMSARSWRYPRWIAQVAEEHRESPETWATNVLKVALFTAREVTQRVIVKVTHVGASANFGIDLKRAPYFFRDREKDSATTRRRKIFHAVAEHDRILAEGRIVRVRGHFRGARTFMWNGYRIHIVSPLNAWTYDVPIAAREFDEAPAKGFLTPKEVGETLSAYAEAS